jgi:hypothetical protein
MNKVEIVAVRCPITQLVIPVSKYVEDRAFERRKNLEEFDRAPAPDAPATTIASNEFASDTRNFLTANRL